MEVTKIPVDMIVKFHCQGVVKGMAAAMKSMNLEKISTLMDNFEKEFEVRAC